jgi:hypothetical protein
MKPIELNGWFSAYDHVCLMQLWGPMSERPEGMPMWTRDLKQECRRLEDLLDQKLEVPRHKEGTEHNALEDAKRHREIDLFLQTVSEAHRGLCA